MVPAPPSRSRSPSPKGTSAPVFGAGGAEAAVGSAGAEAGTGAGAGAGAVIEMPMLPPVVDAVVGAVLVVCGADCDVVELELVVAPEPRLPIVAEPLLRPFSPEAPSALEVPADELWVEVEVELDVVVDPCCTSGVPSVDVELESVLLLLPLLLVLLVLGPASVLVLELLELELLEAELLLVVVPASGVEVESALLLLLELLLLEVVVEDDVVVVVPPPVDPLPGSPLGAGQSIQKVLAFLESWEKSILKW
jgi:hypothetical protein